LGLEELPAKPDGDDKAMILLMLNCAMYAAEVVRLRWDDVRNGCLVTHRAKTGKCVRVAVLWKETLDALAKMQRRGHRVGAGWDHRKEGEHHGRDAGSTVRLRVASMTSPP
jgi:integrase